MVLNYLFVFVFHSFHFYCVIELLNSNNSLLWFVFPMISVFPNQLQINFTLRLYLKISFNSLQILPFCQGNTLFDND